MADDDHDSEALTASAAAIGLTLPSATLAGVAANRALLDQHRRLLEAAMADRSA